MAISFRDAQEHLKFITGFDTAAEADAAAAAVTNPAAADLPYGADYCGLTWVGDFVTVTVYKTGGAGGTTVKTLTFGNDGTNYTSITAS